MPNATAHISNTEHSSRPEKILVADTYSIMKYHARCDKYEYILVVYHISGRCNICNIMKYHTRYDKVRIYVVYVYIGSLPIAAAVRFKHFLRGSN